MKKIALLIVLFMSIGSFSFAQVSSVANAHNQEVKVAHAKEVALEEDRKDPIGIRMGIDLRTGDVLNGYEKGYKPEFETNLTYNGDFSKFGLDWLHVNTGFAFNLIAIFDPNYYKGDSLVETTFITKGGNAKPSGLEAWYGMTFDIYDGLYFNTTFNTNDWMGFYLGYDYNINEKHAINIQIGTSVLWNPNADYEEFPEIVDDKGTKNPKDDEIISPAHNEYGSYYHLDTPFELYFTYNYFVNSDWTVTTGMGYTIPYVHNPDKLDVVDKNGDIKNFANIHRIDPFIGFTYGMFDFMFTLRMEYRGTNAADLKSGSDFDSFTVEPRISMGLTF